MDKVIPALIIVAVLGAAYAGMILALRARKRRQASLGTAATVPAELGVVLLQEDLLYVATTRADVPLERITVAGLGFRARAVVTVAASGVVLDLAGSAPVFVPAAAIVGAGRATWTIDRVVNQDGLVFLRWTIGETPIDSYLRSADPAALVAAIDSLVPPKPSTPATEGAA